MNLYTLQEYIEMGRLKPSEDRLLTIRDLVISGVVNRPGSGIKLLGRINENVESKLNEDARENAQGKQ